MRQITRLFSFALLLLLGSVHGCRPPICRAVTGTASWINMYPNGSMCCELCNPGSACDGIASVECNTSLGEYQPLSGQRKCIVSPSCPAGSWSKVKGTTTTERVCAQHTVCDVLSQYEIVPPTSDRDRECRCIDGWIGRSQCHRCSTIIEGCELCNFTGANSDTIVCTRCNSDRTLYLNASCVPCSVSGCKQCRTSNVCFECIDGMNISSGRCVCSEPNCEECINSRCTKCKSPYLLSGTNNCSLCIHGYVMHNKTCVVVTTTQSTASTTTPGSSTQSTTTGSSSTLSSTQTPANPAGSSNASAGSSSTVVAGIAVAVAIICLIAIVAVYRVVAGRKVRSAQQNEINSPNTRISSLIGKSFRNYERPAMSTKKIPRNGSVQEDFPLEYKSNGIYETIEDVTAKEADAFDSPSFGDMPVYDIGNIKEPERDESTHYEHPRVAENGVYDSRTLEADGGYIETDLD